MLDGHAKYVEACEELRQGRKPLANAETNHVMVLGSRLPAQIAIGVHAVVPIASLNLHSSNASHYCEGSSPVVSLLLLC